jgi:hypothetical protein
MNAQKEVEYIAEIARLNSELKKSQMFIGREMLESNSDLLLVANQCLRQISKNTGSRVTFSLSEFETMPLSTGVRESHFNLDAEIVTVESI